jgi:glycerol-3-phosphate dehydrogenase
MPRDLSRLAASRYDLLVIGGGIHGLFAAYDAARRGLSVALVEQGDFGSGLSFNHQRTLHGGLRELERGRLLKARRQILERRTWARIAPHLLRPLPFLVATHRFSKRSRLLLRAGLRAYDRLGRSRNQGVTPELHLPRARLESASTTRRLFSGVAADGLTGGAVWYDYQMVFPDRLTWTVALAAMAAGAGLVNYAAATAPLREQGRVVGARVKDGLTGAEYDIQAAATLIAAGAGLQILAGPFGLRGTPPFVSAMNLLLDRPARDIALAAPGPSGRMLTLVPWQGYALVGTFQGTTAAAAGTSSPVTPDSLDAALSEIGGTFPAIHADRSALRFVHYGLTPAAARGGRLELLPDPRVMAAGADAPPGLFALIGVKFTSARHAAAGAVDAVLAALGRRGRCTTASRPLPHAGIADVEGLLTETTRAGGVSLDIDVSRHLTGWYGTEASDVLRFGIARGLTDRLAPGTPVIAGEVGYAVEHAQAVRLGDVVLRRTPLGSAGQPSDAALERAADVMAAACGWSAARRAQEVEDVKRTYPAYVAGLTA